VNRYQKILLIVAFVNIAVIMLFPPFDAVPLARATARTFDGFYFVFGAKSKRNFFIPILYMQVSFVLINGALFTLLFGESERAQRDLSPEQVAALAKGLSPENTRKLAKELQQQVLIESLQHPRPAADPPGGNERRKRQRE
jgi:hypothetical protein